MTPQKPKQKVMKTIPIRYYYYYVKMQKKTSRVSAMLTAKQLIQLLGVVNELYVNYCFCYIITIGMHQNMCESPWTWRQHTQRWYQVCHTDMHQLLYQWAASRTGTWPLAEISVMTTQAFITCNRQHQHSTFASQQTSPRFLHIIF